MCLDSGDATPGISVDGMGLTVRFGCGKCPLLTSSRNSEVKVVLELALALEGKRTIVLD
jgi:hypothetical protein